MTPERRMGPVESPTGAAMLDAAELILLEEGYAALSSPRVAEYTGATRRLVYYYFRTMDDLVLETLKRFSRRELDRLENAARSERPLDELWNNCINTSDAPILSEFMAVANRDENVREEVVSFIERSRKIQAKVLRNAISKSHIHLSLVTPEALAFVATSLSLALNREAALGVKMGHSLIISRLKQLVQLVEP